MSFISLSVLRAIRTSEVVACTFRESIDYQFGTFWSLVLLDPVSIVMSALENLYHWRTVPIMSGEVKVSPKSLIANEAELSFLDC